MTAKPCCTPASGRTESSPPSPVPPERGESGATITVSEIPGGPALLGTNHPVVAIDEEGPSRTRTIKPFRMMDTAVTNALFADFIEDTDYVTEAERFGWSYAFFSHLPGDVKETTALPGSEWWRKIDGASWRLIGGPGSESSWHPDHPVVHVTWNDANAFASWAGGRLPTEVEWEHAARGGLGDVAFPWGDREPDDASFQPCNIWQGSFPQHNSSLDGFAATAPVKSYGANGFGLYNMCGNVWEWIAPPMKLRGKGKEAKEFAKIMRGTRLLKGGSFLCHKSYCFRYRIAARTGNTPDTSTAHQGFRLAFDSTPS